ncbi:DUF3144 domain-containing protein [Endozoicomonas sp. SM1973]|uniref:DUF3144 domain-containing protein n=1 Tax=Spartinivicinus marinus TaxID=2994442 RepID=A0A853IBJ1_9GAMM|nr:DUF3144 domain-containing protein [Spartinivicinus marinus]MCX4026829.1 DUF3144 domain-containing protein [Spartinivicinus marinus]MCX4028077.1 DUF3144 domain-containing protein [Spartinivicinus marinus]MCX4028834.1 DUF3144 domain-containing protein [Spartinivicinus marinus]NYZ70359.1 DUF3144 domain-containing protein [Spartinivicinus marinus]
MSNYTKDHEFFKRADEIISLANTQCDSTANESVSLSLLFAAARFNAFIVASSVRNIEELKAEKPEAVKYFKEQYEKMLVENIDEYIKNYSNNIEKQRSQY